MRGVVSFKIFGIVSTATAEYCLVLDTGHYFCICGDWRFVGGIRTIIGSLLAVSSRVKQEEAFVPSSVLMLSYAYNVYYVKLTM